MNSNVIPGQIWWLVYCWMDKAVERGQLESYWFHNDAMLHVIIGEDIQYRIGIMPLGLFEQRAETN